MKNKHKQLFIYKIIFQYITDKKKLDIIIYNKRLQNIFDISIIDYKSKSQKYKVGEKNGKGKEYN